MRIPLPGSQPESTVDARDLGDVDPAAEAEVTVVLRGLASDQDMEEKLEEISSLPVSERKYLTREELANARGAKPEDIQHVEAFAQKYHLAVAKIDPGSRIVKLRGTLADLQNAFGVQLRLYEKDGATFRSHSASILLPDSVAGGVRAVLGLDDHPVART